MDSREPAKNGEGVRFTAKPLTLLPRHPQTTMVALRKWAVCHKYQPLETPIVYHIQANATAKSLKSRSLLALLASARIPAALADRPCKALHSLSRVAIRLL